MTKVNLKKCETVVKVKNIHLNERAKQQIGCSQRDLFFFPLTKHVFKICHKPTASLGQENRAMNRTKAPVCTQVTKQIVTSE